MSTQPPKAREGASANRKEALAPDPIDTTLNLGQEGSGLSKADSQMRKYIMERSILIVDDEENLLILLDRILSKEGYQVKTANNANQALEYVDHESFHVAILDIKMYPIDGVALLAQIKKRSPDIQVIMITAYPTVDTRSDCIKLGAANYLTKPLDIQELKSVVQSLAA